VGLAGSDSLGRRPRRGPARFALLRRLLRRNGVGLAMLLVVGALIAAPLVFLLYGSFSPEAVPSRIAFGQLTLHNYLSVYTSPLTYEALRNTVVYAVATAVLGTAISAFLAYLVERTDIPWKGLIYGVVLAGFGMPGMLQAIAWELLAGQHAGILNEAAAALFHLRNVLFNINTMGGMIFVQSMQGVPIGFLMFLPMMRSMDPALEEAAMATGTPGWRRSLTITVPLLLPGIFAVAIYQMMSSLEIFEIPGILGLPGHVFVFSTLLYTIVHPADVLPAYNAASALSMVFLLLAALATWLYFRVIRQANRFAVVTGRGYRLRVHRLRGSKPVLLGVALLYALLSTVLPFLTLVYASLLPYLQLPSARTMRHLTLANYGFANTGINMGRMLANTGILIVATATLTVLLCYTVSYIVVRTRFRLRGPLDVAAFVPHGIPGIVTGLAFFWVFVRIGVLFGTVWTMAIAFTMQFLPYGTRMMNSSLIQIHPEIEEAARTAGLSPWRRLAAVVVPLTRASAVGLWIWVLLLAVRVAGLPLMLYSGQRNLVLSVVIWNLWSDGAVTSAAAMGAILMVVVFVLMLFARRVAVPQAPDTAA
jgi:iron(III) transport system permease protein